MKSFELHSWSSGAGALSALELVSFTILISI
jgi:hypothetical protein